MRKRHPEKRGLGVKIDSYQVTTSQETGFLSLELGMGNGELVIKNGELVIENS